MIKKISYCVSYYMIGSAYKLVGVLFPKLKDREGTLGQEVFGRRGINYITFRVLMRKIEYDKSTHSLLLYGPPISVLAIVLATTARIISWI